MESRDSTRHQIYDGGAFACHAAQHVLNIA